MPDRLGRVPAEPEVPALDGKVGGQGQFLSGADAQQSAVVADAKPQFTCAEFTLCRPLRGARADAIEERKLAALTTMRTHNLRIGYAAR